MRSLDPGSMLRFFKFIIQTRLRQVLLSEISVSVVLLKLHLLVCIRKFQFFDEHGPALKWGSVTTLDDAFTALTPNQDATQLILG